MPDVLKSDALKPKISYIQGPQQLGQAQRFAVRPFLHCCPLILEIDLIYLMKPSLPPHPHRITDPLFFLQSRSHCLSVSPIIRHLFVKACPYLSEYVTRET